MKKPAALLILLLFLFAACGGGDEVTQTSGTGAPDATATAQPGGTDDARATQAPAASGTAAPKATATSAPAPPKPAAEGKVNRPKAGEYTYAASGESSDPFNPAGPKRTTPPDSEAYVDISHDGDTTTSETFGAEGGSVITRTKWSADTVHMLSIDFDQGAVQFGCVFNPPILITKFPVKVESFGPQQWSGDDCEGTTTIDVLGKEKRKDSNGKEWDTWKVHVITDFRFQNVEGRQDQTQWVSPALGVPVATEESFDGTFTQGPNSIDVESSGQSALKSYP